MQITDSEKEYVITRSPTDNAHELAKVMVEEDVGSVVITESGQPVGIITDRDLVTDVLYQDLEPSTFRPKIMSEDIATADVDDDIFKLVRKLETKGVRRLPVIDNGTVVNIVTLDDLNRLLIKELVFLNRVAEAESPFRVTRDIFV